MLTRGSPGRGVLKTAWLDPDWRGWPKRSVQSFIQSAKRTFFGVRGIASRVFFEVAIPTMVPLLAPPVESCDKPEAECRKFCQTRIVALLYLPITRIWKECGIMGGRGPRIQAGGVPAGGVVPAGGAGGVAGAEGVGPYSAVME